MPAPSKPWTTIADAATAPDAPLDTTLITAMRDDLIHVRETVYDPAIHTAAVAHNHDGVNSALLPGEVMGAIFAYRNFY